MKNNAVKAVKTAKAKPSKTQMHVVQKEKRKYVYKNKKISPPNSHEAMLEYWQKKLKDEKKAVEQTTKIMEALKLYIKNVEENT